MRVAWEAPEESVAWEHALAQLAAGEMGRPSSFLQWAVAPLTPAQCSVARWESSP